MIVKIQRLLTGAPFFLVYDKQRSFMWTIPKRNIKGLGWPKNNPLKVYAEVNIDESTNCVTITKFLKGEDW